MSRLAFRECGFLPAGTAPSLDPLVGWFWPFTLRDSIDPDDQTRLLPFTAAEFFQLTWNIKSFRVSGSWNFDPSAGPGSLSEFDFLIEGAASERGLIASGAHFSRLWHPEPQNGFYTFTVDLRISPANGALVDGVFYPEIAIETIGSGRFDTNTFGVLAVSGVTCTFMGRPVTLYTANGGDNTTTGTLTIAVEKYWEYRDAAGANPVFDADTGAQLITPVPRGL